MTPQRHLVAPNRDSHPYTDLYTRHYSDADADAYINTYTYFHAHFDADANSSSDSHTDANPYSN